MYVHTFERICYISSVLIPKRVNSIVLNNSMHNPIIFSTVNNCFLQSLLEREIGRTEFKVIK